MTTMTTLTDEQLARMTGSIDVMSEARCREVLALLLSEVRASRAAPPPDLAGLMDAFEEAARADHGNGIAADERDALLSAVRRLAGSAPATVEEAADGR